MGKTRERQIILKTEQRTVILEQRLGVKFQAKSSGWDENRVFLEGGVLEVAVRNGRWVLTHVPAVPRPAQRRPGTISRPNSDGVTPKVTVSRGHATSSHDTVTRSDAVTSDPETAGSPGQICKKRVGEKQADRLRLLIVAGGHGAFVAAFRNRL
jgi:hypothetical protein